VGNTVGEPRRAFAAFKEEGIMKSFFKKAAVAFVLATALCGQAKADLVSSAPEANAAVIGRVQQIALTFSEGVKLEQSKINVRGPRGSLRTTIVAYDNNTVVLVAFWAPLTLGRYTVDWHVISFNKHKSRGTYTFSVKRISEPVETSSVGIEKAEPAETTPAGVVDLNTASADDLDAHLGRGAPGAAAIIAGRPYASVDELVSKGIVSEAAFDSIKNRVVVAGVAAKSGGDEKKAPAATGPVDVNTATVDELDALPDIGPTRAASIVAGRPYKSVDDLLAKGLVSQATFDRIKSSLVVVAGQDSPGK
jgi:DNA uptake protein ComE-like DNA-binding protein/methionine-rich copper-binding protein CopC